MKELKSNIIVVGFNIRPLAYSLSRAGYKVYAVDFFGDLDLAPYIEDSLIITEELQSNYEEIKDNYKKFLAKFTLNLLERYPDVNYILIGSGLDDALEERKMIENKIKQNSSITSLNNDINTIENSRNIFKVYEYLELEKFSYPLTKRLDQVDTTIGPFPFPFPLVLKKTTSSGGTNVFKINNKRELSLKMGIVHKQGEEKEWLLQEYIKGNPVSCTLISNGMDSKIITVNQQIIGMKKLNPPREFIYCGNTVPLDLSKEVIQLIIKISHHLAKLLRLKGINGFDFVVRGHQAYLMEINPRIPGSIRASEEALGMNLLQLHVKSFYPKNWNEIVNNLLKVNSKKKVYCTKLIFFAPKTISRDSIEQINKIQEVHDKSDPTRNITKGEPVCTILYQDTSFSGSQSGALKIVDKINTLI
ncbi:MAG: Carbamoyl-phosphate synthase large chain [Promethearchaeota archaeon]|nr:MAG: Carbamoyl-phosphate synthase large chain [Candidatus Lokiarchaeota archaeon]